MFGNYLFCLTVVLCLCAVKSSSFTNYQKGALRLYDGYCRENRDSPPGDFGIQLNNTEYRFWALAVELIDNDKNIQSNLWKEFHNAVLNRNYNNRTLDFETYMPSLNTSNYGMALGRVIDLLEVTISRNSLSCVVVQKLIKRAESVMIQRQEAVRIKAQDCRVIALKLWEKIMYLMQAKFDEMFGRNYKCEDPQKSQVAACLGQLSPGQAYCVVDCEKADCTKSRCVCDMKVETSVPDTKTESNPSPDFTVPQELEFSGTPKFIERLGEA